MEQIVVLSLDLWTYYPGATILIVKSLSILFNTKPSVIH